MTRTRLTVLLAAAAVAALAGGAAPAQATLPGTTGRIAFWDFTTGQIYTVAPDGSSLRRLTNVDSSRAAIRPKWSPDGRRIIFTVVRVNTAADNARIWIMRADGTHARQLSHDQPGFRHYAGSFSANGRWIVFARCQPDDGVCAIWRMRADGTHMRAVTPFRTGRDEAVDFTPSFSAHGAILFTRFFWHGVASQEWVIPPGGEGRPVTPARLEAANGDWAPSGRAFAFNDNSQRFNGSLWRIGAGGGGLRRLTETRYPHSDFAPTYSPDGHRIAFVSDRRYPDLCCLDLFAADSDGTHLHRIPTGELNGALEPAWGPRAGGASSGPAARPGATPHRSALRLPGLCSDERLRSRPYC
jgi:Tol biopolymer transport system component